MSRAITMFAALLAIAPTIAHAQERSQDNGHENHCPWTATSEYRTCSSPKYGPGIELFYQPANNDNSCGIRQMQFARGYLNDDDSYCSGSNILPMPESDYLDFWQSVYEFNHHTEGTEKQAIKDLVAMTGGATSPFHPILNAGVPHAMKHHDVEIVGGGPMSLPSSLARTLQKKGFQVKFIYDAATVKRDIGQGNPELEAGVAAVMESDVNTMEKNNIHVDTGTSLANVAAMRAVVTDANTYYMFVINHGTHWVGATTTAYMNSGCHGPSTGDIDWEFGAASGMMIIVTGKGNNVPAGKKSSLAAEFGNAMGGHISIGGNIGPGVTSNIPGISEASAQAEANAGGGGSGSGISINDHHHHDDGDDEGMSSGAIAGIVIGTLAVLIGVYAVSNRGNAAMVPPPAAKSMPTALAQA